MKIGLLGGSFNPPHLGHLILASQAEAYLGLDKIVFIPCFLPPHKKRRKILPVSLRLKMLEEAVRGRKSFVVSRIEAERGGLSYTVDTVEAMRRRYRRARFYLIIGDDLAQTFVTWKDYRRILKEARVVVASRHHASLELPFPAVRMRIPSVDISSSLVRKLVSQKRSISYLVPPGVEKLIKKNRLYQERRKNGQH